MLLSILVLILFKLIPNPSSCIFFSFLKIPSIHLHFVQRIAHPVAFGNLLCKYRLVYSSWSRCSSCKISPIDTFPSSVGKRRDKFHARELSAGKKIKKEILKVQLKQVRFFALFCLRSTTLICDMGCLGWNIYFFIIYFIWFFDESQWNKSDK